MAHLNATPCLTLRRALATTGGAGLLLLTLASPGATRMHAWPWTPLYWITLGAPIAWLLACAADPDRRSWVTPAPRWLLLGGCSTLVLLLSAILSPFSGPSLLWSAPLLSLGPLALALFQWLHADPETVHRRKAQLLTTGGAGLLIVVGTSLALWTSHLVAHGLANALASRNPYPLGHSNYTAGLALVMLPVFSALLTTNHPRRGLWLVGILGALAMLFTSGSRGGLIGLAVWAIASVPALARKLRVPLWPVLAVGVLAIAALLWLNPRTRTLIGSAEARATLAISDVQRIAMAEAGWAMGRDRPWLGWGPGVTPLAYPHYRAQLNGGADTVLQLHSLPVQLWGELGASGLLLGLIIGGGVLLSPHRPTGLAPAVAGYLAFSLTDWQLDVPIFNAALGTALALALPPPDRNREPSPRWPLVSVIAITGVCFALVARPDPVPALNTRALALAAKPENRGEAITLLNASLAQQPNQEIAHFNLAWLLVTTAPAEAAAHFRAAAALTPDKGGVHLGYAFCAINLGQPEKAIRALALETINDPLFLSSPYWQVPELAQLRADVLTDAQALLTAPAFVESLQPTPRQAATARHVAGLLAWAAQGQSGPDQIAAGDTAERRVYFATHPAWPAFAAAPIRTYHRSRTGYPVLMRNLDLAPPLDVFQVAESTLATDSLRFLFPEKGWLPTRWLVRWATKL